MSRQVYSVVLLVLLSLSSAFANEIWNVTVTADVFGATQYPGVIFEAGGDCIVVADQSPIDNFPYFRILRRNSTKQYDEVYRELLGAGDVTTNGNWHGYLTTASLDGGFHLFQLDSNNEKTNIQQFPELRTGFGYLLSDDTFVFVNRSVIRTYAVSNGNWSLIQELPSNGLASYYIWNVHVDSKIMSGFNTNMEATNGTIFFWTRNADLTWSSAGSIDFDSTIHPEWARWSGDDLVYVGDPGLRNLRIYSKGNDGQWTFENFKNNWAGVTGYFPSMAVVIDANTAVFSAPQDGYLTGDTRVGASVVLTRVNGQWNATTIFKADRNLYMFSAGLNANDYDLVFYSVVSAKTTTFYTVPLNIFNSTPGSSTETPSNSSPNSPHVNNEPASTSTTPNAPSGISSTSTGSRIKLLLVSVQLVLSIACVLAN